MVFKKFIKATSICSDYKNPVSAPIVRKAFEIPFTPDKANLKICVSGFYELYINGKNITRGFLSPYISNPDDVLYYDTYDVAPYICEGKNAIALILGNGFVNQDIPTWDFDRADFRAPVSLGLTLTASDEKDCFELYADESFSVHSSPILYDMYRLGTVYDARLECCGFSEPDFDDVSWDKAMPAPFPKGDIKKSEALPITTQYELKPLSFEKQKDIYYFYDNDGIPFENTYVKEGWCYDFGYSCAGVCRLKIKGEKGQRVTLRHSEYPRNGKFNMNSILTIVPGVEDFFCMYQADTYILKGGEEEIYIPSFTYHGFRYVLVEGIADNQATEDLLTFMVFNTDVHRRSFFNCSDDVINKLYEMAIHSDLSNFHHFPTDCPHREKNGWTGDISVSAHQLALSLDCRVNMKMWLECLGYAQTKEGKLPGIVPTAGWGYEWGCGPAWDSVAVNMPYFLYKYDMCDDIIRDNLPVISSYLHYIASKRNERGLIACGLGDWVQPLRRGDDFDSPLEFTDSSQIYEIALRSAFLFEIAGKTEEKKYALSLAEELKSAIRNHLVDFDTCTVAGSCQTSQAIALKLGLFEENEYDKAYRRLIEIIHSENDVVNCGMIGLRYIFHVLFEGGDAELALKLITNEEAPSYKSMINMGGTALFESLIPNGCQQSQNHHFYGDIINLFIRKLSGLDINPYMTDNCYVKISPVVPQSISFSEAEYMHVKGKISTRWEKRGTSLVVSVHIPEGIRGEFVFCNNRYELKQGKNLFEEKL